MLMRSQGIKSYITEFGTHSLNKITGGLSSGRSFRPDVFISHLIFRYPNMFVNQLQEKSEDSSEDLIVNIDLSLATRYIIEDARSKLSKYLSEESNDKRKFLSLDKDAYQKNLCK